MYHYTEFCENNDLEGNEIADTLSKAGACEVPEPSTPLTTFLEIFSRTKHQNKTAWITPPPEHHWYQCSRPGGPLAHSFTRQDQTLLARFQGHIKTMKISKGRKSFEMCTNCSSGPATLAHILECLGLTKQDLADDPLLVLDFLKVYDAVDLLYIAVIRGVRERPPTFQDPGVERESVGKHRRERTATAGSDVVQSGRPIFDDFFQHLWPYIGNTTANVVFQMVKRLWLIRIDQ
ncbi:RNase H domain-containing protein [Trichonephila clavipes]|nr:RNase H domain-containing protein [Trichonephila clavipes]